jgi:hypothetical protein
MAAKPWTPEEDMALLVAVTQSSAPSATSKGVKIGDRTALAIQRRFKALKELHPYDDAPDEARYSPAAAPPATEDTPEPVSEDTLEPASETKKRKALVQKKRAAQELQPGRSTIAREADCRENKRDLARDGWALERVTKEYREVVWLGADDLE